MVLFFICLTIKLLSVFNIIYNSYQKLFGLDKSNTECSSRNNSYIQRPLIENCNSL